MLTRSQVAKRLGRSVATVRRLEGRVLHPTPDGRGVNRFDPDEVHALVGRLLETGSMPPLEGLATWSDVTQSQESSLAALQKQECEQAERLAFEVRLRQKAEERAVVAKREGEQLQAATAEGLVTLARRYPNIAIDVERLLRRLSNIVGHQ